MATLSHEKIDRLISNCFPPSVAHLSGKRSLNPIGLVGKSWRLFRSTLFSHILSWYYLLIMVQYFYDAIRHTYISKWTILQTWYNKEGDKFECPISWPEHCLIWLWLHFFWYVINNVVGAILYLTKHDDTNGAMSCCFYGIVSSKGSPLWL